MSIPRLTLAFLGTFSAALGDTAITAFRTDKVRALLAYLALEAEQAHNRHALAGLLWPDLPERQSLDNLRVTLYRLRHTLDAARPGLSNQVLTVTRQSVQLNAVAICSDVLDFEAGTTMFMPNTRQAGRLQELAQAVALYRGELLPGFSLADASTYEEWLLLRREQLAARALLAVKTLADAHEAQGELEQAHRYATRLLELDPYGEASRRQLMRILTRLGLPHQALAQYAALRQLLRSELGVEPNAQTTTLYEQIRDGRIDQTAPRPTDQSLLTPTNAPTGRGLSPDPPREIPFTGSFVGRTEEVACLTRWVITDSTPAQLIMVLGLGGVGKTSLIAHTARTLSQHFDRVLWRSLLNAPPLDRLVAGLLQTLAEQSLAELPADLEAQLALLFDYLRRQRVLLILDNLESVLEPTAAGHFRPSYEAYEQLLWLAATSEHRSVLLSTSRERPAIVTRLAADTPRVQSLFLKGLDEIAGQKLLAERGIADLPDNGLALVARYSGNPLALKLVADTVQELFAGDVASFLSEDTLIFDDVRKILEQQLSRLSELERAILFWLAIEREAVDAQTLRRNLIQPTGPHFLEALRSLQNRSLIERHHTGIGLQNVVMEYLTERLVATAGAELQTGQLNLLHHHALLKAQSKDDIRQSQTRLILAPLVAQIQATLGKPALLERLRSLVAELHQSPTRRPGYSAANLFHLLRHLEVDLTGWDFSQLSMWQADLRGANLAGIDLSGADLAGAMFTEDFGRIFTLALHPQGHLLAAGGAQGAVRIWSFPHGQNAELLSGHTNAVTSVAFSPDGTLLVSGSLDRSVRIWDWRTGRCLQRLTGHSSGIFAVAFSPDGKYLASGGQDHTVRLWAVENGTELAVIPGHSDAVLSLAFHPRSKLLAVGSMDHLIYLWDLTALLSSGPAQAERPAAQLRGVLRGHEHQVLALAFHPDGTLLATSSADTTIRLWTMETQSLQTTLRGHTHWVRSILFSRDGNRLISGSADRTIRIWDVAQQRTLEILRGHEHTVRAIAIHPDGSLLASGGLDDTIRLWDLHGQPHERAIRTIRGHVSSIRTLAFSPDHTLLATGDGKGWVRLWPVTPAGAEPAPPHTLADRGMQVNCVAFSPDGRWLASADDDRVVRLWELATRQISGLLRDHKAAVHTVCFAPQGQLLATAGYDGEIYLWDVSVPAQSRLRKVLSGHTREVNALSFTPEGKWLISGAADNTLRVWDVATGRCIQVIEEANGHCKSLAFAPTRGLVAAAGWAGIIRLYRLTAAHQLDLVQTIQAHATRINQVAFSADGRSLVSSGQSGTIRVWDVDTGRQLLRLHGHTQPVESVAFAASLDPEGQLLASGGEDETMRLWVLAGEPLAGSLAQVLHVPGPYAGMKITGATGISDAQRAALVALGAVDEA